MWMQYYIRYASARLPVGKLPKFNKDLVVVFSCFFFLFFNILNLYHIVYLVIQTNGNFISFFIIILFFLLECTTNDFETVKTIPHFVSLRCTMTIIAILVHTKNEFWIFATSTHGILANNKFTIPPNYDESFIGPTNK